MEALFDLYVDYLIASTSYTTATGLSKLTNNAISHDKVTRVLSSQDFTVADLWMSAKQSCRSIEEEDGVLIIDDTIGEKPYIDENELICWHFDHKEQRSVKGINILSSLYKTSKGTAAVGYEIVRKTEHYIDEKTGKAKRKSPVSKQEHCRNLILQAINNGISFKYVLYDSWFASVENMKFIISHGKDFIMPIKANRKIAISEADRDMGNFVGIDSLKPGGDTIVWLKGIEFPLRFVSQLFKNEDGSTGILNLVSSNIELTDDQIVTIYQKRWKIEVYHKSLKSNLSLLKSPTKKPRTQANHVFASVSAYNRLEGLSVATSKNHFDLKNVIYMAGLRSSMAELNNLKSVILQM